MLLKYILVSVSGHKRSETKGFFSGHKWNETHAYSGESRGESFVFYFIYKSFTVIPDHIEVVNPTVRGSRHKGIMDPASSTKPLSGLISQDGIQNNETGNPNPKLPSHCGWIGWNQIDRMSQIGSIELDDRNLKK